MRSLIVLFLGVLILLAGCGSGGESGASQSRPAAKDAARPGGLSSEADAEAPKRAEQRVKLAPETRAIVYTARMRVRVADVKKAAAAAVRVAERAGGHVAEEDSRDRGRRARARLVLKVPPDEYAGALAALGRLGTRTSLRQETEDVTEKVADVESRIKSAEASLKRLRDLMAKADEVGDVLKIQRELARQESDLESLQARRKKLAERTGMATITLHLTRTAPPARVEAEPGGFVSGLDLGWQAFLKTVNVALMVLGVLLPWLAVAGAVLAIVLWIRRRLRARRPA